MNKKNKLMAVFLCLCMMFSVISMTAFAQDGNIYSPTKWSEVEEVINSMNDGDILDMSGFENFDGSNANGMTLTLSKSITIQGTWDIVNNIEGSISISDLHFVLQDGVDVIIKKMSIFNDDFKSIISGNGNLTLYDVYFSNKQAEEVGETPLPIIDVNGDVTIYGTAEERPINGVTVSTTIQGKSIKQTTGEYSAGDAIHANNVTIYGGNIGGGDDFGYRGKGGNCIVASGDVIVEANCVWGMNNDGVELYSGVNLLGGTGKNGADAIIVKGDVIINGGSVSGGNGEGLDGVGGSAIRADSNVTLSGEWLKTEINSSFTDTFLWAGFGNNKPGIPIILTNDNQIRQVLRINGAKVCGRNKGSYVAPYTIEMSSNDLAIIDDSLIGWYTDIPIFSNGFYKITNPINTWGTLENASEYKVTNIDIDKYPKTEYIEGDKLDLSGISVKIKYSDLSEEVVSLKDFGIKDIITTPINGTELSTENTSVNVSIENLNTLINITVKEKQAQVASPIFSVDPGSYKEAQHVEITCATENAKIYYTIDGLEPTVNSIEYTEAVNISESMTLKAIAVKSDMKNSKVTEAMYIIENSPIHIHNWEEEWSKDENAHWHNCVVIDCPITENDKKSGYMGHSESEWITTIKPTETSVGEMKKECTVCGYVLKVEEIPATGDFNNHTHIHRYGSTWQSDNTHHWKLCTAGDGKISNKEAHTASDWINDKQLADNELSKQHKICTVCGYMIETLVTLKVDGITEVKPFEDGKWTFYGDFEDLIFLKLNGETMGIEMQSEMSANLTYLDHKNLVGKIEAGSVKVTLFADFLKTLPNGTYKLEAEFAAGQSISRSSIEFTVSNNNSIMPEQDSITDTDSTSDSIPETQTDIPNTGYNSHMLLWVLLMLLALTGCGSLLIYDHISENNQK